MDRVERLERGGFICWGVLLAVGAAYDLWAFHQRRQTLSTAVWIVQRKLPHRLLLLGTWGVVTFHFFVQPVLRSRAKVIVLDPGTDYFSVNSGAEGAIRAILPLPS
jgi:hypothetical protein